MPRELKIFPRPNMKFIRMEILSNQYSYLFPRTCDLVGREMNH